MFFQDLLFPKFCLGCGFLGSYICLKCQKNLYYVTNDICIYCRRNSLYGFTHPACKKINGIDGSMSIFYYNNLLKNIIKSIKYRFAVEVWKEFCLVVRPEHLLKLQIYKKITDNPIFIEPVPLHSNRLRMRGFNQAELVAIFFNAFLHATITKHLVRVKDTPSQAKLEKQQERISNIQGAFVSIKSSRIAGKRFILVDDVQTTGATLKEATRVLKKNRASQVYVLTIAHG